eukprot:6073666-Pleurochrysis_carterae.AAC.2
MESGRGLQLEQSASIAVAPSPLALAGLPAPFASQRAAARPAAEVEPQTKSSRGPKGRPPCPARSKLRFE